MTSSSTVQGSAKKPVMQVRRREPLSRRLRLDVPTLYRNPTLCASLEQALAGHPGLERVQAKPLTSGLLLVPRSWQGIERLLNDVACLSGCVLHDTEAVLRNDASDAATETASAARHTLPVEEMGWHTLGRDTVIERLAVSLDAGLDMEDVNRRLRQWGANSLEEAQTRSALTVVIEQFASLPVGLLGISAAISIATGGLIDAAVILGVVLINAAIGYATERQAERTIAALSHSGPRYALVMRDGERQRVGAEGIVPGDVLLLGPGSYVAADARLVATRRLTVDESALTGESMPVSKDHADIGTVDTPLGDRINMVYMGTTATGGDGVGVVVNTGCNTELGKIQSLVNAAVAPDTPLERQLDGLGTQLGLLSAGICAGVFGVGLLRGFSVLEMLKASVSLAVAAVPEGLPAVATSTLALGIREMQRHRVAVRQLNAVETLGSVQTVCLDKTGTLTRNHMTLVSVFVDGVSLVANADGVIVAGENEAAAIGMPTLQRLLHVVCLCSEAEVATDGVIAGSPTEQALVEAALAAGLDVRALRAAYPRRELRPRAEDRPLMSTFHETADGGHLVAVKGSPTEVLARCSHVLFGGHRIAIDQDARDAVLMANQRMAADALRVLGVAMRDGNGGRDADAHDLTWLGLVGLADPLRSNMPALMTAFHDAGIETVMITGDQSATALAIGRQLGLSNGKPLQILDSQALDKLDPELLAGLSRNVHVFARVSPAHKLKIVQALQQSGHIVAMTGDGINDGPALKAADIGIALGAGGTDVARQVSDVVLEDDNLETLITAVHHGRSIYANIRKTIHFLLATNFSEIEVMLAGVSLGLGQPLTPMQLLWINLLSDIFPGLALSMETPEPDLMRRRPRDPAEPVVRNRDLGRMAIESGVITAGAMAAFAFGRWRYGPGARAGALAFNTLTTGQLLHAYVCRSNDRRLMSGKSHPRNRYLDAAVGGSLALQAASIALPPLRRLLGSTPLSPLDLLVVAGGAVVPYFINEMAKPTIDTHKELV